MAAYTDAMQYHSTIAQDELRRLVAGLVLAAGGQRAFERRIGVSQAVVSRYLAGGPLTMPAARRLYHAYPGLRERLEGAVFQVRHADHDGAASVAAS
jgi:transcriptional regulator with XRE-family HTH domain